MPLTDYVTLGRSGLRVSPFCLGTMTFGEDWGSEAILGESIGGKSSRRDRVVIATKFFGNLYPGDPNGGGAGRKSLLAACEQSLRRLKTDYIDLYWMHAWDHHTPLAEVMRAIEVRVRVG